MTIEQSNELIERETIATEKTQKTVASKPKRVVESVANISNFAPSNYKIPEISNQRILKHIIRAFL